MAYVTVNNDTNSRLLFSIFNKGDSGVPFHAQWIDAGQSGQMNIGKFNEVGVGVQIQEGGRWIGGDPKDPPYFGPQSTVSALSILGGQPIG
ncbi:hypothetical protein [Paracoccus niistensis]|uniref:Uncharacterized protein n=1 Tax=Paracoccus niistensis TaxID=632935 RepID=A0ABV6HZE8_9RHOB